MRAREREREIFLLSSRAVTKILSPSAALVRSFRALVSTGTTNSLRHAATKRASSKKAFSTPAKAAMSNPIATFDTTEGSFKAEVYLDVPLTSSNFIDLCKTGFYDGLHFHRVIDGFMLNSDARTRRKTALPTLARVALFQTPKFNNLSTGEVITRDAREGCIPDELTQKISNDVGTLSMANTGQKNSGGSQFFINTVHNNFLDWFDRSSPSAHPVFGKVTEGMDVVMKISRWNPSERLPKERCDGEFDYDRVMLIEEFTRMRACERVRESPRERERERERERVPYD